MMMCNLIGFSIGVDGMMDVIRQLLNFKGIFFFAMCLTLSLTLRLGLLLVLVYFFAQYITAQMQFYVRLFEARRSADAKGRQQD